MSSSNSYSYPTVVSGEELYKVSRFLCRREKEVIIVVSGRTSVTNSVLDVGKETRERHEEKNLYISVCDYLVSDQTCSRSEWWSETHCIQICCPLCSCN